jgi:cytochrome c oxidase assembly protein subunit 23
MIYWQNKIRSERRAKGIEPYLPNIAERDQIKQKYMNTKPASQ